MAGRAHRRSWGHVRKLPSGTWQASYLHQDVRHRAASTFTARTDAEHWLATERRLIERDEWTPPGERENAARTAPTLEQYALAWVRERPLKETTRSHYRTMLSQHVIPALGSVKLERLTAPVVRAWYSSTLVARPTYRAHCYSLVHAICSTAVRDGLLVANPCQIPKAMTVHRRREPVILSPVEVAALAEAMGDLRMFVLLSAWCGTRLGETLELRRKDASEGAESLSVARGVVHRGGCTIGAPKSGRGRSVVVPPHLRADLKHHLDAVVGPEQDALLFAPRRGGCHVSERGLRHRFHEAVTELGHPTVTPHSLRHYAGTMSALAGATLPEIMNRLGHSTSGAAMRYQSVVDGRPAALAEALSRLVKADTV